MSYICEDLFEHVFIIVWFVLGISFIYALFTFVYLFAEEKKETYNLYLVLESKFRRENIALQLWHGCVCLSWGYAHAICNLGLKGSGKKDVVTLRVSPCMKVQLLKFATEAGDPTPKDILSIAWTSLKVKSKCTTQNIPQLSTKT